MDIEQNVTELTGLWDGGGRGCAQIANRGKALHVTEKKRGQGLGRSSQRLEGKLNVVLRAFISQPAWLSFKN
jgi:hypothetical protein